jgi:exosortase
MAATLAYFFEGLSIFSENRLSAIDWARSAWNPEGNMEHGRIVPFISLYLFWYHRRELLEAPKKGSSKGMIWVGVGILLFLMSARCLQPRMALVSIPFLLYGSILYLWGKEVARICLFPCAFLIFMIPVAAVEQATFRLQFIVTDIVGVLARIFGIHVQAVGTTLTAADNSFHFEVAGGCSGIRSITALTMISAVYAHLTQTEFWKKIVLVLCSAGFAIVGNVGRIFTILIVARFFNADIAGGAYHEISGYLIFPFAIAAMVGTAKLLNIDYGSRSGKPDDDGDEPPPPPPKYDY